MSYCTLADVEKMLPAVIIDDNTRPSSSEVEAMVARVSAELDMLLLTNGYALPVTDASLLAFLRTVSIYGTCANVLRARAEPDPESVEIWARPYRDWCALITSGQVALSSSASGAIGDGFRHDADGALQQPYVRRKTEF